MVASTTGFLERIVAHKAGEVAARQEALPLAALECGLATSPPTFPFAATLHTGRVAVIAEIKRASPSRGVFAPNLDAAAQARLYAEGGAAAISVLTDEHFFHGSLDDLRAAAAAVALPLLRKDFVLDRYQLVEARVAGASLALLIVAMLDATSLRRLLDEARNLGLEPLVEVHTDDELHVALESGATLIGINNRDLATFTIDLATTERLADIVPPDVRVVSESGIHNAADVARLRACGVHAVLVGESLVRAGPGGLDLLRSLTAEPSTIMPGSPLASRQPPTGGGGPRASRPT